MPYRPGDGTDLQGDVVMVTPSGDLHRLHIEDGPCLYLQDMQTGQFYEVCLDLVVTTPPAAVSGEVLHGTALPYAVFGPDGTTPTTPTPPTTEDALIGTGLIYAAFGEIEV